MATNWFSHTRLFLAELNGENWLFENKHEDDDDACNDGGKAKNVKASLVSEGRQVQSIRVLFDSLSIRRKIINVLQMANMPPTPGSLWETDLGSIMT